MADIPSTDWISWVYHTKTDKWTKFTALNLINVRNIHHGTQDINLFLTSENQITKYPGDSNTTIATGIMSKKFYIGGVKIRKLLAYLSGTGVDLGIRIHNRKFGGAGYRDYVITNISDNTWEGILSGYYGDYMEIYIIDADTFEQIIYDFSTKGAK